MNLEKIQIISWGIYAAIGAYYVWEGIATKIANFFQKPTRYYLVGASAVGSRKEEKKPIIFRSTLRFKGKSYPSLYDVETSMEKYINVNKGKKRSHTYIDFIKEVDKKDFNSFLPEDYGKKKDS